MYKENWIFSPQYIRTAEMKIANLAQIEFDRNLTKNTSQGRSNTASWIFSGNDFLTGLPDLQFYKKCHLFTISDISCKFFLRKYYVIMEFYLSHTTALQLFRAMRIKGHGLIHRDSSSTGIHTEFLTLELGQIKEKVFSSLGIMLTEPIELVVDEKKNTYQSSRIKFHTSSHFAQTPCMELSLGTSAIKVASPFELMIEMAQEQTLLETVMLISEFQGRYVIDPSTSELRSNWYDPVFQKVDFERYLSSVSRCNGIRNARLASSYSFDNAASPMEVKLALRASLPVSAGGYAIPKVELNKEVRIQQLKSRVFTEKTRAIDLLLSKGNYDADTNRQAAIEYNGAVHELAEVSTRDYRRNNELVSAGTMEFVIGKAEYDDIVFMDNMFNSIRNQLEIPRRHTSSDRRKMERAKRIKLWSELEKLC